VQPVLATSADAAEPVQIPGLETLFFAVRARIVVGMTLRTSS
jgi:hypothetical protein